MEYTVSPTTQTDGSSGWKFSLFTPNGTKVKNIILTVRDNTLITSDTIPDDAEDNFNYDEAGSPKKILTVADYLACAIRETVQIYLSLVDDILADKRECSWVDHRRYALPKRTGSTTISVWSLDGIELSGDGGNQKDVFKLTVDNQVEPQRALDLFWSSVYSFDDLVRISDENAPKKAAPKNKAAAKPVQKKPEPITKTIKGEAYNQAFIAIEMNANGDEVALIWENGWIIVPKSDVESWQILKDTLPVDLLDKGTKLEVKFTAELEDVSEKCSRVIQIQF